MKTIPRKFIGRFARIQYDDIGVRDGIIVAVDREYKDTCTWLGLGDTELNTSVCADQIVAFGNRLDAHNTGL